MQLREEHWVIADLVGKGGHVRTIPVPDWVKAGVDNWVAAAGITTGPLLRSINKAGRIWGNGFSPKVIWGVVKDKAASCEFPSLAPHDLRRTCARLCHQAGGELEQIQFLQLSRPLPWLFLRRPIDVACDMLPILSPALGFDPSTRFGIGPTSGSGHAH